MSILDICRKNKGSISIMLCMLLLPMVTYASMIIDASRLQSAKVAVSGAGDLTMNASLSEYEQTLHDIYGLFAMVQDEKDLEPALQDYFKRTIEKGLSGTGTDDQTIQNYAKAMSDWVLGMGDSDELDFDNFLNMEVESVSTEGVESSALANPAVLERQIIDYMKYRGPVSLVSTLFSKLSFLKNSSAQTEVIENKVKYTESLSELQDPCEAAYTAINQYNEASEKISSFRIGTKVTGAKQDYQYAAAAIAGKRKSKVVNNDLLPGGEIDTSDVITIGDENKASALREGLDLENITLEDAKEKLNDIANSASKIVCFSAPNTGALKDYFTCERKYESDGKVSYECTVYNGSKPFPYWNNLDSIKSDFTKVYNDFANIASSNEAEFISTLNAFVDLQNDIINPFAYNAYKKNKAYIDDYIALKDLYNEVWEKYSELYLQKAEDDYKESNPEADQASIDAYVDACKEDEGYKNYSDDSFAMNTVVDYMTNKYNVNAKMKEVLSAANDCSIYDKVADYFQDKGWAPLNEYYQLFVSAISKLDFSSTKLDEVLTAIESAETAKKNWQDSIDKVDTGSTKAGMQSDLDTTTDGLNKEEVNALKTVIAGIKTAAEGYKAQLEQIKFIDVQLLGNDSRPDFKNNEYFNNYADDSRNINDIGVEIKNDKFVLGDRDWSDSTKTVSLEIVDGYTNNGGKKELSEDEKFYLTLKSICDAKGKTGLSDEDSERVDAVNDMVDSAENFDMSSDEDTSKNHKVSDEEKKKLGEILDSIAKYCDTADVPKTDADTDTSKTKDVKIDKDSDDYSKQGDSAANALEQAKKLLEQIAKIGETVRNNAYLEEYFTEMYSCDTDRVSLVGEGNEIVNLNGYKLNSDTAWYGKEIEFILWGDSNPDTNLTKNYAMIYMIRFALNAIYAFTAPDIQSFALSTATAIAGWTVIGVPIVQAVITIGLALAESGVDVAMLKAGEDVAIYKSASTFVCSPTGALNKATKELIEQVKDKAVETVQLAASKLIDDTVDKMEGTIRDNKEKIQAAATQYVDQQASALTSSVKNLFITPILNKITPIMNEVNGDVKNIQTRVNDAVDGAFETIKSNIESNSDGALKDIALDAYDAIVNDNSSITKLKSAINEYFEKVDNNTNTEKLEDVINTQVDGWNTYIKNYVTKYTDKVLTSINDEIEKHLDDAATSVKGIINDKTSDLADSLSNTLTTQLDGLTKDLPDSKDTLSASGAVTLNYKEYCKIFVFLEMIANKEAMLKRSAALMEANVQAKDGSSFKITKAYTLMHVNADIKMKTLFSWGVEAEQNDASGTTGYSFSVGNMSGDSVTLKYDGINGY